MIAAVILLSTAQPRTWIEDGKRRYVDDDGELWTYYALCIKCSHLFAIPATGPICCVCLAANS